MSFVKKLSVNDVDIVQYFPDIDDGGREVAEGNEATLKLLVSHEQLAELVETAVADLCYSSSRFFGSR